jgi:hypothetical protein
MGGTVLLAGTRQRAGGSGLTIAARADAVTIRHMMHDTFACSLSLSWLAHYRACQRVT